MKKLDYKNPQTFEEAASILENGQANILAGGTDLINVYKHALLKDSADTVVNIKNIPDAAGISEEKGKLKIKALTTLVNVAESEVVNEKAKAVAEAAYSVATPLIRNMATIGGNICQDVRCWYYRYPHEVGGRLNCARKGGETCYAPNGENRYHSIFGGMKANANACTNNCPAGTDISAYMEKIRKNDWDAAARIIMQVNPMPMFTSRICPHPCQDHCNQTVYGESVGIHCVERTLGDYIIEHADRFYTKPEKESGKNTLVIGAGPGGLTAAYFLRRAGHGVTVMDAHEKAGGVLRYGIPHYRLPKSLVDKYVSALEGMGVTFKMNTSVGKDVPMEELVEKYDGIYVGTGAWKQPVLGISGEELTEFGLDFLTEVNSFLKDRIDDDVLVCGGGNVAMDVALTAKRMGAKNVRLICLEKQDEMPASSEEVARAVEEGIEICNGWGLKGVVTNAEGKVTGLESMRCLSVFDENHRFSPVYDENDLQVYEASTIILATGQRVDISFLGDKFAGQLKTARGLIDTQEETYKTKNEKIYAGGDVVTGPNIAIRAIHAGGNAAKAMSRDLGTPIEPEKPEQGFLTFDAFGVDAAKQAVLKERGIKERTLFDEDAQSLGMEEARKEAARCMNCGCYSVNASDISPTLVALDADIVTTKKTIKARDFFTTKLKAYDMLDPNEIVTAIEIPDKTGYVTGYHKDRIRKSLDFAVCSLAFAYKMEDGKIEDVSLVFGGVAPVPVKLDEVEKLLIGSVPSPELAKKAGELSVKAASPMSLNEYKVHAAKALVERVVEDMK